MSPAASAGPIDVFAPAKINLALHVVGQRADGYHLLDSVVVFADIGDRIRVEPAECDRLTITGRFGAGLDAGPDNLVSRARDALRAVASATPPVAITLDKALPVASGIGGGSSDAAATLTALNRLWDLRLDAAELARIGLQIGADVPMCLARRAVHVAGIGEIIRPLSLPALPAVLVNPGIAVSTPAVFRRLERRDNPTLTVPEDAAYIAPVRWLSSMRNDLEAPAIAVAPVIGDVLDAIARTGSRLARMSGSGATCFGLYPDTGAAQEAASGLSSRHPDWTVQATLLNGAARNEPF